MEEYLLREEKQVNEDKGRFTYGSNPCDGYDRLILLNFGSCATSRGGAFIRGIGPRQMLNLRDLKELD